MNLLDIDKASDDQKKISEEVNDNVMEHLMAGIEIISGRRGSQYLGVSHRISFFSKVFHRVNEVYSPNKHSCLSEVFFPRDVGNWNLTSFQK